MDQHFVRIVEDGTLAAEEGWAFGICTDTGQSCFITERSAMTDERRINEAWAAARDLAIEQAVRDGIVEYVKPDPSEATSDLRDAVMAGHRDAIDP